MERLSIENLIKSDNPILHNILQYLDLETLQSFSEAINTNLRSNLDITFDLYRKLNPWRHNKIQPPLKVYKGKKPYEINRSIRIYSRCLCKYCLDSFCCLDCFYRNCRCRNSTAFACRHHLID